MALSEQSRYSESEFHWIYTTGRGSRYTAYLNTITFMTVPYTVHVVKVTDTLAILAAKYYGDTGRWWVIADANPQVFYPNDLVPGQQIRIPQ